ncbi:hypothetical protein [Nocardia sp. NPDC051833]|uniref:hypothetical protein n=1 Tax=Nocardia sp. NPDC051833 TaxID=3155674 RepID=UPI003427C609
MAIIQTAEWLVTSSVAQEAAFRIDLPGPDRGRWTLSYLPGVALTEAQAISGLVLAEMILLDTDFRTTGLDREIAELRAAEFGLTLTTVMALLAARATGGNPTAAALPAVTDLDGAH